DGDLAPLAWRVLAQHLLGDARLRLEPLRAAHRDLIDQQLLQPAVEVPLQNRLLVVPVLRQPLDLRTLDSERSLILIAAPPRNDPYLDSGSRHPRRQAHRGVADVRGLLAEDGAQQLLLRRHRRLALRRDLANQDVAGLHRGADIDDAGLVEVLQRLFADVGDIAGDLFLTQLRVAGHHLELLDVNRGEDVIADDALGNQDRVLEVVALPRH